MGEHHVKITPLVRQWSHEEGTSSNNIMSQALSSAINLQETEEHQLGKSLPEWWKWLQVGDKSDDDWSKPLDEKQKQLVHAWDRMKQHFPEADVLENGKSTIPTAATLHSAVIDAKTIWKQQKQGAWPRTTQKFLDFVNIMNDHSYLFKFIPTGDKYVSLIAGVVTTIVKVSANYQKIVDGFSDALVDINFGLDCVRRELEDFDSLIIRKLLVDLYVKFFTFLTEALLFFCSKTKRLKASLSKTFYDKNVEFLVKDVYKTMQHIRDETRQITQSRIRNIVSRVEAFDTKVDHLDRKLDLRMAALDSRLGDSSDAQSRFLEVADMWVPLGFKFARALEAAEQETFFQFGDTASGFCGRVPLEVTSPHQSASAATSQVDETQDIREADLSGELISRYELLEFAKALDRYMDDGRHDHFGGEMTIFDADIPDEVMFEFRKWLRLPRSKALWAQGMPSQSYTSAISLLATQLCNVSLKHGVPCISVFLKGDYSFASDSSNHLGQHTAAFIALLYSIVSQLIQILPRDIEMDANNELAEKQFELLDGSLESANTALQMIDTLFDHATPTLMCIIDGIELAECAATLPYLEVLLKLLRLQQDERICKLCFTTQRPSIVLQRSLELGERIDASRMSHVKSGKLLPGSSSIFELNGLNSFM